MYILFTQAYYIYISYTQICYINKFTRYICMCITYIHVIYLVYYIHICNLPVYMLCVHVYYKCIYVSMYIYMALPRSGCFAIIWYTCMIICIFGIYILYTQVYYIYVYMLCMHVYYI